MLMKRSGYLFSAAGGLLGSILGFRKMLRIGAALMMLAIALMAFSIWFGLVCNQIVYTLVWTAHPFYMWILLPSLFFGFIRWANGPRSRTVLVVLYYLSAGSTIWFNMKLWGIVEEYKYSNSHGILAIVGLISSMIFVGLAFLQNKGQGAYRCELPTNLRVFRYILIITAFTPFVLQLNDGHILRYQREVLQFFDETSPLMDEQPLWSLKHYMFVVRLINQTGYYITGAVLVFISVWMPHSFLTCDKRMMAGIKLAAGVSVGCLIANCAISWSSSRSPTLTFAVFALAAFLDGVSEILTMVAGYEFVDDISPRTHRLLVTGIMFSMWSLTGLIDYYVLDILIYGNLLGRPVGSAKHRANHIIDALLLGICFLYTKYVSIPQAYVLRHQDGSQEQDKEE